MMEANPDVDPWSPKAGTTVVVPAQFILPAKTTGGVVINIAEMRLYYFHADGKQVSTFPIGIGKRGWNTPLCVTKIIDKKKDPTWTPPESIREAHAEKGDILPGSIGPGPKNPLGKYAMKLGISGYLIHGTNRHGGIGVRSSAGCIRMFPEDIEALFHLTPVGTKVAIINAPFKITRHGGKIYFEAHEPLTDSYYAIDTDDTLVRILDAANIDRRYLAQMQDIAKNRNTAKGFPVVIN
jgi:L,D-transpeptidase ErfK/SrfK